MTEEQKPPSKVSEFAGRREKKADVSKLAIATNQPSPGGDQGTFDRPPCGECIHWKKSPGQGLGIGVCMMMPPSAHPVNGPDGRPVGMAKMRPAMQATDEGCDQFEDEEGNVVFDDDDDDPEGDGTPAEPAKLAATG